MDDREWKNQEQNQEQFNEKYQEQFEKLRVIWEQLNALQSQVEQAKQSQEKKEKSDRTLEQKLLEAQEKIQNFSQNFESAQEVQLIGKKEIRELENVVKFAEKKLWKRFSKLGNNQTSYSFENAVSTEFADEWRKESSDEIPQLVAKAPNDKSLIVRAIAPLMDFASA